MSWAWQCHPGDPKTATTQTRGALDAFPCTRDGQGYLMGRHCLTLHGLQEEIAKMQKNKQPKQTSKAAKERKVTGAK